MHVLLVDHDEADAVRVRDALWSCRYDVTHCGQMASGLAQLETVPIDVMLAALHLPDAEGVEVVHRVRGVARHLPLVVMAGPDDDALAEAAVRSGAQDCLPKAGLGGPLIERSLRYACERARLEAALEEAETRLRIIQDRVPATICDLTPDGTVTGLNAEFQAITGWPPAEWIGRDFVELLHPEDRPAVLELLRRTVRNDAPPALDVRMRARQGGYVIASFSAVPVVKQGRVSSVVGIARDVTELRQLETRQRDTSRTDHLTGLGNRRACEEAITREVARAMRENASVVFVLFDLDHFKVVNDTHGHHVGDAVLRAVAGVLREASRSSDLVGRWGGEELLAILPRTDLWAARPFAERVRSGVAALDGLPSRVTVSAGMAEWTRGQDVQTVLARADAKLYEAKRSGRNRIC
ncbi:MAG TPA: diguanylate cyclase [Gemmatimonadales bacterium]|nr:diguanylate cyclase [Gemmatimonadales bacterium]